MLAAHGAARHWAFPLHAILLAFPIALFTAGVLTDLAYLKTAHVQWTNFSSWLIAGALVFGGVVGAWAIIDLILGWRGAQRRRSAVYVAVLAAMWILGLINAFHHTHDAWTSVGTSGLVMSIVTALLALVAGFIAYSAPTAREIAR